AYKAIKGGGLANMLPGSGAQSPAPSQAGAGGGLGDILGGMFGGGAAGSSGPAGGPAGAGPGGLGRILGGLVGGRAAGSALNGGLRNLVEDMQQNGQGGTAQSWVGNGANKSISPHDLASALGANDIQAVADQTGMSREQVLSQLSQHLPEFVNQLTPDGRLPSDQEANSRW